MTIHTMLGLTTIATLVVCAVVLAALIWKATR